MPFSCNYLIYSLIFITTLFLSIYSKKHVNNALLNICLSGKNHKNIPSSEPSTEGLVGECKRWSSRNCCLKNTTKLINEKVPWYGFNVNHCNQTKNISEKCHRHFIRDACFFECSPNIGPWIKKIEGKKFASEKFFDVPLCAEDCENWWEDCKEEYTCSDNWYQGFNWINGTNYCSSANGLVNNCQRIADIFKNSQGFCENIWNYSFKYIPHLSKKPCFKLNFDGKAGNPNEKVAYDYVYNHAFVQHINYNYLYFIFFSFIILY
ncbi:unnamed protein product [Gordionus sp. m RMFG-2023]|uniref:folate receptor gamma-like n=1 Tax=Gordionus sp. m RMFG-2023 TaxID=3053472 RepID=UPI0030DFC554